MVGAVYLHDADQAGAGRRQALTVTKRRYLDAGLAGGVEHGCALPDLDLNVINAEFRHGMHRCWARSCWTAGREGAPRHGRKMGRLT